MPQQGLRITEVEAFAVKFEQGPDQGNQPARRDDFGDYYIASDAWSSIYSRRHETMVVRIATDAGIVGYGEGQSPVSPRTTSVIVEELCRPVLLGRDPFDVEAIWQRMFTSMRERGHPTGFFIDALAGCDIALWDIMGKAVGKPVHRLLGGRFRDCVPVYAGFGGSDPEATASRAAQCVSQGHRAIKLHPRGTRQEVVRVVEAVCDRVGPQVDLMVDVHTLFSVAGAIKLGRDLERLGVAWLESPTAPEDIQGQVEIARALDMPVAIGEWSRTRFEMRETFERRAFDIAMPDIARTGLTEGKKIASLADTYNIPISPHVGGGGIISVAATVHFSAAIPNFMIMEHPVGAHDTKCRLAKSGAPVPAEGAFALYDAPGLGLEVDEDTLRSHAVY